MHNYYSQNIAFLVQKQIMNACCSDIILSNLFLLVYYSKSSVLEK